MTATLPHFRDLLPVEQFDHMLNAHGLPYDQGAALLAEREHDADHRRRPHDHEHTGGEAA
jgi:hypothetical protein